MFASAEDDRDFGGEWTTTRLKEIKREPVRLEEAGASAPTPSFSEH